MTLPLLILGAGGHARVLIDALKLVAADIVGAVDPDPALAGSSILGVAVLGDDRAVDGFPPAGVRLVAGLGSVALPVRRQELFQSFQARGYSFASVVHPSATVAADVVLGEGAQVMAGAVIQTGSSIGCNAVINTRVSVDHDCCIGDHVHLAPGVTLSGGVRVGSSSHIGTGAVAIQGVSIGRGCLVAAGAVVTKDIPDGVKVRGVPAREFA